VAFHRQFALSAAGLVDNCDMKTRLSIGLYHIALPGFFASLAVTVLLVAFGKTANLLDMLWEFSIAALYSLFIGVALSATLPKLWVLSNHWVPLLRWPVRCFNIAAGTAFGVFLGCLCLLAIFHGNFRFWPSFWRSYLASFILASTIAAFIATFDTYKERLRASELQLKEKELERERALQLATSARLSSLESRVHPHFLFNTLNSVASLIHEDPKHAEIMVNQLAELLRFSLDSANGGLVPLEREMKIVEDYLSIEHARFGERLRYSIEVTPGLASIPVPPLALQTLVENSVKYAVGPRVRGATIDIKAQMHRGLLELTIMDDGPGFSVASIPTGHGLNNLEERLAAIYGENGKLDIQSSVAGTVVILAIPATLAKAA